MAAIQRRFVTRRLSSAWAILALGCAAFIPALAGADGRMCELHPERSGNMVEVALQRRQGLYTVEYARGIEIGAAIDPGGSDCTGSFAVGKHGVGVITYYGSQHCTGTLVAPTVVLTAAHCVHNFDATALEFRLGPDGSRPAAVAHVIDSRVHLHYDPTRLGVNDVAVLYLSKELKGVAPIEFRKRAYDVPPKGQLVFIGYGNPGSSTPGRKRCLLLPVENVCGPSFDYGKPDRHPCRGDSGGPALERDGRRYVVAGLTSWGTAACDSLGVSMDVGAYYDFIRAAIADGPEVGTDDPGAAPWPPDLAEGGTVVLDSNDAVRHIERLVIPARATVRFDLSVQLVSWTVGRLELGPGATLDLSSGGTPARAADGPTAGGQPSWGVPGAPGSPGTAGAQGRSGRQLSLLVSGPPPTSGSLWIRTDGAPGQVGGNGGRGQLGGGSSCGKCLGFGPDEPKTGAGRGGQGGAGGNGGYGGDTSHVVTNVPLQAGASCRAVCGASDRPIPASADGGEVVVWGAPGCGSAGGVPGAGGAGDRGRSCPCPPDVASGPPGPAGERGGDGRPGSCGPLVRVPGA